MKKLFTTSITLFILITGIFVLSSCDTDNGEKGYTIITEREFENKMEANESFIFVLAATYCEACSNYEEDALEDYDGDVPVYILNIDEAFPSNEYAFDQQALFSFLDSHSLTPSLFGISDEDFGTPTSYAIQKGIVLGAELGYMDERDFNDFLDDNF